MTDIKNDQRWLQRLDNLDRVLLQLQKELADPQKEFSLIERTGIIHFFEMAFELSWKTLKDFFEYKDIEVFSSPRDVIKHAGKLELLDSALWLTMLEDRNLSNHTYDEKLSIELFNDIKENTYVGLFTKLSDALHALNV